MLNLESIMDLIVLETGIPKKDIKKIIDTFLKIIKNNLSLKEQISLYKFGKFTLKKRLNKNIKNVRTKEIETIPEYYIVHFKPSSEWKNLIKERYLSSQESLSSSEE